MKKLKIFFYHLVIFVLGSVGITIYSFSKLKTSVGGAIAMPVVTFFYIVVFGILCLLSLLLCFMIRYLRVKRNNHQ